jgi:hypothetical protein
MRDRDLCYTLQYMAIRTPVSLRIRSDLLERVDVARGDVPRTRFIERALESALESSRAAHPEGPSRPTQSRASGLAGTWAR